MQGLSREAQVLLGEVERDGQSRGSGAAARELEVRLLARGEPEHTASGRHAKVLEAWPRWADRVRVSAVPTADAGRRALEERLEDLNRRFEGRGRLPWQRPRRAGGRGTSG